MKFDSGFSVFLLYGPLVGIVLIKAVIREILDPVIGMFGFSLSLSIPFVLFALFLIG